MAGSLWVSGAPLAPEPPSSGELPFLAGGGEMGARMRAHDWAATPLGPPASWPQSLRSVLSVCLNSPMLGAVLWGEALLFLYNDAYLPSLADRHPDALGRPVADVWGDAWQQVAAPFHLAMRTGEGFERTRVELPMVRRGQPETTWWNFTAATIRGEDGQVVGLLNQGVEITEQVLAERRAAGEQQRQRGVLQQMPGFIGVLGGPDHVYEYVNDAFVAITGVRRVVGLRMREAFPELVAQGFHDLLDQAYTTGVPFTAEALPLHLEGDASDRYVDLLIQPIRDDDGRVTGIFVGGYDVTERVRGAEALRRSQDRLNAALEVARLGSYEWDIASNAIAFDERAREMFQADDLHLTPQRLFEHIDPAHLGRLRAEVADSRENLSRLEIAYDLLLPDGTRRSIVSISHAVAGADGRAARIVGVFEDVTERRATAQRLLTSEGRYRQIVEGAEDFAIVTLDDAGVVTGWNTGAERITGFAAAEAIGRPGAFFFTPEDRAAALPEVEMQRVRQEGRATGERWHPRRDGNRFWGSGLTMRLDVPGGGYLKMFRDRTAEHEAEALVRRSEERLRDLNQTLERRVAEALAERKLLVDIVDTTATFIQAIDANYRILAINQAAADEYVRIYGMRPAVGDSVLELLADRPALQAAARATWAPALAGQTYKRFETFSDPMRERRCYDLAFEVLRGAGGEPLGAFMTGFDVTDRMRDRAELEAAQEALRQSQKMEAVGKLTGGIAHDFNNMLAVVIGSLDLLGRRLAADDTRARRHVDAALDGARRAALLTQRLLAFSRQQPLRPEAIDVNRLVVGMSALIRGSIGSGIRFETRLADGAWRAHADPNQLENVLLNLAVNARDAMPGGGRLTIETHHVRLGRREAAACGGVAPGGYVLLTVTDTGTGMSADVIARAFDPFFTTKEVGKGTGLGLSQVYGFVAQSGGHVGIESTPGQGTTMKVYLPRLIGKLPQAAEPAAATPPVPGTAGETILVVEDEPAVRRFSVDALGELGYRVLDADGAAAALPLLDAHPEIALLFTDVVMPDVDGRRLADQACQRRPGLKVLFTTGYTRDAVVHDGVLDAGVELIGKPFTIEALGAKVRAVLGGGPGGSAGQADGPG